VHACRVVVRRYDGDLDMPLSVSYATKDGTAIAGLDYKAAQVCGQGGGGQTAVPFA